MHFRLFGFIANRLQHTVVRVIEGWAVEHLKIFEHAYLAGARVKQAVTGSDPISIDEKVFGCDIVMAVITSRTRPLSVLGREFLELLLSHLEPAGAFWQTLASRQRTSF